MQSNPRPVKPAVFFQISNAKDQRWVKIDWLDERDRKKVLFQLESDPSSPSKHAELEIKTEGG